ncbi:MAG TPA: hypothetical protein VM012_01350 [Flavitalea sp.]|nr:hypothetical protein [Flavitalea sp.]
MKEFRRLTFCLFQVYVLSGKGLIRKVSLFVLIFNQKIAYTGPPGVQGILKSPTIMNYYQDMIVSAQWNGDLTADKEENVGTRGEAF